MQVDGVSPGNAYGLQKVTGKENAPEGPSGQQPLSGEVADVSGDEPSDEEEKGVIRLLLEGHFKGVSDVRLRINLFDEIAAIEAAQMQAVTDEKMGGVLESVGGAVDSFLANSDLTEEEKAAVSEAKDSFLQAVNGADDPASTVKDAFAAFLELLQALVPPHRYWNQKMSRQLMTAGKTQEPTAIPGRHHRPNQDPIGRDLLTICNLLFRGQWTTLPLRSAPLVSCRHCPSLTETA